MTFLDYINTYSLDDVIHRLTTDRRFLVEAIVRTNPVAIRDRVQMDRNAATLDEIVDMIMVLDPEEQGEILSVPWNPAGNGVLVQAYDKMSQALQERGLEAAPNGQQQFLIPVVLGLGAVAQAYFGAQSEHERQAAEADAQAAAARAQAEATRKAQEQAEARKSKLMQVLPWASAILIVVAYLIYRFAK